VHEILSRTVKLAGADNSNNGISRARRSNHSTQGASRFEQLAPAEMEDEVEKIVGKTLAVLVHQFPCTLMTPLAVLPGEFSVKAPSFSGFVFVS
jgi:hypothetical protein